ncbi:NEDD4 family-interacting protein 2 [Liparis tanakae]|uniref:NEDD4 family-interacting protein 2 n=1 Tax=Liparis tanakae TaxID=230148 RepID=A0A4Z2DYR5_9TELE|nr:NEDD4 family-interacting protein 2 [Liparis tanakae]
MSLRRPRLTLSSTSLTTPSALPLLQLHNEEDSSEASGSGQQPCTSAQAAGASGQEPSRAEPSPAPAAVAGEASASDAPPPPYASIDLGAAAAPETSYRCDFPVPPPYSVATSLPTYDEAEKAKAASLATSAPEAMPRASGFRLELFVEVPVSVCVQDDEFPPREDFSDADQLRVGNDGIFMLAFFSKSP